MKILVTGANGFIGRALVKKLAFDGHSVIAVTRSEIGELDSTTDWRPHLKSVETVVHLAARVHIMQNTANNPLAVFHKINVDGTRRLAEAAKFFEINRFIFVSTIKVNGDHSNDQLTAKSAISPQDHYALSKWKAEQLLFEMTNSFEVVIIRPPLVYGPGVKGNFLRLMKIVDRGIPLPLSAINNKRSLIGLTNLTDAISHCLTSNTGTYLPSDRQDLSTPELIRTIAKAFGKKPRLFPVPEIALRASAKAFGKSAAIDRLSRSLTVDGVLPGWIPPENFFDGILRTAAWYRGL